MANKSTLLLIVVLAFIWSKYNQNGNHFRPRYNLLENYDYVVVGGGSAGAVVANRLSEDESVQVALIEAGPAAYPDADKPANYLDLQRSPIDWQFVTEPQDKACLSLQDGRSRWPRGKVLGGSSMINGLMFMRGARQDYDLWSSMGCDGWSYKDVLPYFIKSESTSNVELLESGYHGNDGPQYLEDAMETLELKHAFIDASQELGMKAVDNNGKDALGVHYSGFQRTVHHGSRWSTAHAFLYPILERKNLHILTEAQVTKVLFKGKKAVGVEYIRQKQPYKTGECVANTYPQVYVRREVILSAGAVMSPLILMHSGIGPKEELEKHEIEVLVNLPVGKNLQDHINVDTPSFTVPYPVDYTQDRINSWISTLKYKLFGTGLQTTVGTEATTFFRTPLQGKSDRRPFIQILMNSNLNGVHPYLYEKIINAYNYKPEIFQAVHGAGADLHGLTFLTTLLHPRSVGQIRLKSKDPLDPPVIDPNYLDDPEDVEHLLYAIRLSQRYENTTAFRNLGMEILIKPHPECATYGFDSDDYWRCYIRHLTFTIYHPVGTCKMGSTADPTAVVDPQLRVKGVESLRVIDASVIPTLTSGNTHAPSIMIGEKGADIIRGKKLPSMPNH